MIDPNDVVPAGNQFRQMPNEPGMAPPQVPQSITQGVVNQHGVAAQVRTHPFFFSFQSSLDGKLYEGQFTSRKLSLRDIAALGVRKVQLNGGYHYDEKNPGQGIEEHIDHINSMIAHLELALVQQPTWFNFNDIFDPELLTKLYMKVVEFENNFFRRRGEAGLGQSVSTDSSPAGQQSSIAGHVTALGGNQVQASLDP